MNYWNLDYWKSAKQAAGASRDHATTVVAAIAGPAVSGEIKSVEERLTASWILPVRQKAMSHQA